MATPTNRSPWVVKFPGKDASETKSFRLRSQAEAYLAELPPGGPTATLKQLNTAFEAQIQRIDKNGVITKRRGTFDTYEIAEKWIKDTEAELDTILKKLGSFTVGYETITFKDALTAFHKKHYAGKSSFNENEYRVRHLVEWIGKDKLLRDLTRRDMIALRDKLQEMTYSASSIRNYFTVLTSFYKKAIHESLYPVENIASGFELPKPDNAVQRYWVGSEHDRLMKSLALRSPWLIPIVEISREMAFRRGELVKRPNTRSLEERELRKAALDAALAAGEKPPEYPEDKDRPKHLGGLKWENVDWDQSTLTLLAQKNDKKKAATEYKGRTVPMTSRMREILWPLYQASKTKQGDVFEGTINSVTTSFSKACQKAEPPIKKLTFHSMRKIGTKDLSGRVKNPMQLAKLTSHKDINVLYRRYFEITLEELAQQLDDSDATLAVRGMNALTKALGAEGTKKFLDGMRTMESKPDISPNDSPTPEKNGDTA